MSGAIRCLIRMNFGIINNAVNRQLLGNASRSIYTEASLGLTEYKNVRSTFIQKYQGGWESFRSKMENSIADEKGMVFTEDLKAALHLVEKNPQDITLLRDMLRKYNNQDAEMRFGTFRFGPVVMRAFYYLNEPDVALELFKDPAFDKFFDQVTTFMVLLDLLYENQRYAEVREVYDKIRARFVGSVRHPKLAVNVVAVSCYKENTPESFDYGKIMIKEMNERGSVPLRRVVATIAALALNQNCPPATLEILSLCSTLEYVSIRCLRMMALADMDRVDDIVMSFQAALRRGIPERSQYFADVVPKVQQMIERNKLDETSEISELLQTLIARNYISTVTLDDHLLRPIQTARHGEVNASQRQNYSRYEDPGWSDGRPNDRRNQVKWSQSNRP